MDWKPRQFLGMRCLSAKEWDRLTTWLQSQRADLEGRSPTDIVEIALRSRGLTLDDPRRCPIKNVDENAIREACRMGNIRFLD